MKQAKLRGSRLIKVQPAKLDLERLKPHLKPLFGEGAAARWQSSAKLNSANDEFRDKVSFATVILLTGSVGASHRAHPSDRNEIKEPLRRQRKVVRLIERACRLYETGVESIPPGLERVLIALKERKAKCENAAAQLKQLRQGRAKYHAFEKCVRLVGEAYETATGKAAMVNIDYARAVDKRCSGPFGELLEEVCADAAAIWKMAKFTTILSCPCVKNARLDYARKIMMRVRRAPHEAKG
jgi:hypothetical protein